MTSDTNIFPRLPRGGYTCRIHFMNEARGETYFDSEWAVQEYGHPGKFTLTYAVDYRGYCTQDTSGQAIGTRIRAGDKVALHPRKHNLRGSVDQPSRIITVTNVRVVKQTGFTELQYELSE